MFDATFTAVVWRQKLCPACSARSAGIADRVDCGCLVQIEIGRFKSYPAARRAAEHAATRRGSRRGWRATGSWCVETGDGVTVASR